MPREITACFTATKDELLAAVEALCEASENAREDNDPRLNSWADQIDNIASALEDAARGSW